jgi:hypothetical protein
MAHDTFEPCTDLPTMTAFGKPDIGADMAPQPVLTHKRHKV